MSLKSVLLLRADPQKLAHLFDVSAGSEEFAASGGYRVKLLADGALIRTNHAFGMDPASLLSALRAEIGRALALHHDERGLFVLPSVAEVTSSTVDDVIEEVDAGGEFLPLEGERASAPHSPSVSELLGGTNSSDTSPNAASGAPDISALLGGLSGPQGGLPDLGALAEQMGFALPEGAAAQVTAMLQGEGGSALLEAASQIAQNLSGEDLSRIASGDMGAALAKAEGMAAQMGLGAQPAASTPEAEAAGEDETRDETPGED